MKDWGRPAKSWLGFGEYNLRQGQRMKAARGICGCLTCLTAWHEEDPDNPEIQSIGRQAYEISNNMNLDGIESEFLHRIEAMRFTERFEKIGVTA